MLRSLQMCVMCHKRKVLGAVDAGGEPCRLWRRLIRPRGRTRRGPSRLGGRWDEVQAEALVGRSWRVGRAGRGAGADRGSRKAI